MSVEVDNDLSFAGDEVGIFTVDVESGEGAFGKGAFKDEGAVLDYCCVNAGIILVKAHVHVLAFGVGAEIDACYFVGAAGGVGGGLRVCDECAEA